MSKKQAKILMVLIVILVVIDQIIKIALLLSNGIIQAANNQKTENNISYILISIIAIIVLVRYIKRNNTYIKMDSRIIISFAIAGCISNLIDRIWNGETINYINIPNFVPLNLAYIYILVTWIGMAAILTKYTVERINEKNEKRNNSK